MGRDFITQIWRAGDTIDGSLDRVIDILLAGGNGLVLATELRTIDPFLADIVAEASRRTEKELRFEQSYRAVMKRVGDAERELTRITKNAIASYRTEVLAIMGGGTDWDEYRLRQMRVALGRAERTLYATLYGGFEAKATEISALALAGVNGPLAAAGLPVSLFPTAISQDVLKTILGYVPSLIVDITTEQAKRVSTIFTQRMLGGLSQAQARQKLIGTIGTLARDRAGRDLPGKVFSAARIRADRVFRTELNRIYNTTTELRIDDLAQRIPGIGKVWVHRPTASRTPRRRHAELNGTVIFPGNGEKFDVAGYLVDGPYDPALPAEETINCHCRVRIAYSAEVAAEQERRGGPKPKPVSKKARKSGDS